MPPGSKACHSTFKILSTRRPACAML
ncbi:CG14397 [Drosophila busckii]|uniref:CG14397 n=1 Tax=Drosophila busckii TaxID=30019 RepID=A0A0M4E797_DROBS|nr:CG14397 [Drosophila busckii]ALC40358.1 CG14397 [Drosophila busckii]